MILLYSQFVLSMFGVIIGGITILTTLVLGILALIGSKYRMAIIWLIGFLLSAYIVIFSAFQIARRIKHGIQTKVEWSRHQQNNLFPKNSISSEDYAKLQRQNLLDSLQLLVEDKYKGKIPYSFYSNIKQEYIEADEVVDTLPFIYPYAFKYNNYNYNLINVLQPNQSALVENISKIKYNKHFILIKVDRASQYNYKGNEPEIGYILFDLKTGVQKEFLNSKKLIEEAIAMGYSGNNEMEYITDVYKPWFDSKKEEDE